MIFDKVLYGNVRVLDVLIASIILILAFFVAKGLSLYLKRALK
jgi:hypothetical protein